MTCSCYTNETNHCNDEIRPKRLIQSANKSSYWQVRQKTGAIEAILQPSHSQTHRPRDLSNPFICAAIPDGVMKTTSKIKFGNESASRYHKNCSTSKPKPKRMRNTIRRNIAADTCVDCPCAKNKGIKFKNECYCVRPPNKPRLPGAPEWTVPVLEEDCLTAGCDDSSYAYRPETLQLAKDIIDYIPQSTFLSRMYRANCKKCMCNSCVLNAADSNLKYTERRLLLENAYHKIAESNRINYDKLSKLNCVNISGMHISPDASPSSTSCGSAQPQSAVSDDDGCVRRSCLSHKISNEQISSVKSIRKKCYFETHSKPNVSTTSECNAASEEHKCIFKYTIDDRGLLAPLNPDAFGTNRCSICNKAQPEERPSSAQSKDRKEEKHMKKKPRKIEQSKDTSPKKKSVKQPSKISTQIIKQLTPKQSSIKKSSKPRKPHPILQPAITAAFCAPCRPNEVCNPTPDKTVQLELKKPTIYEKNSSKGVRPKYVTPVNSWALRYQKGCSA